MLILIWFLLQNDQRRVVDDLYESSSGGEYSGDEILALLRARVQRIKDDIKRYLLLFLVVAVLLIHYYRLI